MTIHEMDKEDVGEGQSVYILGYPMSLVDPNEHYAVLRSGSIARIRDTLEGRSPTFLLDAFIFPGNSGGPVFKPDYVVLGSESIEHRYLVV